jgi:hypothetical protein
MLLHFFIFIIVLFLYVHIIAQYKRSEDLEIYEMDYTNNSQLQEVCNLKQPTLFEFQSIDPTMMDTINSVFVNTNYDVTIKDTNDYYIEMTNDAPSKSIDSIVLPYPSAKQLMNTDPTSHFITENNEDFIEESGYLSVLQQNINDYLKPSFIVQTKYDICTGSRGASTPLRYHNHYRHFLIVSSGKIRVKMTPWKSSKYLYPIKDYENYEFRSPINAWTPQKKYANDIDKVRFLEFDVMAGYILYIPAYWWYSIQYVPNVDTVVCNVTYNSTINILSNTKDWVLYFIQQQNIHKKLVRVKSSVETQLLLNNENNNETNNENDSDPEKKANPDNIDTMNASNPPPEVKDLLNQLRHENEK